MLANSNPDKEVETIFNGFFFFFMNPACAFLFLIEASSPWYSGQSASSLTSLVHGLLSIDIRVSTLD